MPFIKEILKSDSLSIVGLEKNTGKTECLKYILDRLPVDKLRVAVTSIGIDGETTDQVTGTGKPQVFLKEGMLFATSEKFYKSKRVISEIIGIGSESGPLGRVVTAKVICGGSLLLAGPQSTDSLKVWMNRCKVNYGAGLTIIDGALSRLSLASPAVSSSMILSTGAALSSNIDTLVNRSAFVVSLIKLPITQLIDVCEFEGKEGMYAVIDGVPLSLGSKSTLSFIKDDIDLLESADAIYISGALTDRFLKMCCNNPKLISKEIIVKDFTKVFATKEVYDLFIKRGGEITVTQRSNLIAVCINPVSPNGIVLDSDRLKAELSQKISLPVYDIKRDIYEA